MTKHNLIRTIVEQGDDNPNMMQSLIGTAIYNNAKTLLTQQPDIETIRALADSMLYIIEQMDKCTEAIKTAHDSEEAQSLERQRAKYYESLIKCVNQL
jgi:hypothetical protein